MKRYCTLCGTANAPGARFCVSCGITLDTPGPAQRQPAAPSPATPAPTPSFTPAPWPAQTQQTQQSQQTQRTVGAGRYVVEEAVGQGGMSAVYRARDTHFSNRVVAVKEMVDQFADAAERAEAEANFKQEADLLASLRHSAIPLVIDRFSENSRHYLVMEYIDGQSLEDLLEARNGLPLPEDQVRGWAVEICSVLSYLHDRTPPIIFRDLKPSNVMIDREGQLRLIDFGIARLFKPQKKADTTALGTTGYASPEHYTGQTDPRSDIYSLGAMLHYLLSGRDPSKHPPFQFPPLRELNPAVSPAMEALVLRCLSADREVRFASTGELRAALLAREAPPPVQPVQPAAPPPPPASNGQGKGAPSGKLLVLADLRSGADRAAIARRVAGISNVPERMTGALLKNLPAVVPITQPVTISREVQHLAQLGATVRAIEPATDIVDIGDDLRTELHTSHQLIIWDATVGTSKTCQCRRCGHTWRTKKPVGDRVPRFCPNCGSNEWSKRRLFKCGWCGHEFEHADLTRPPEALYPQCPGCGLTHWLRGKDARGVYPVPAAGGSAPVAAMPAGGNLPMVARAAVPIGAMVAILAASNHPAFIPLAFFVGWAFTGRPGRRRRRP